MRTALLAAASYKRSTVLQHSVMVSRSARFQMAIKNNNQQQTLRLVETVYSAPFQSTVLQYRNSRSRASCTTQARPLVRFSPVIALHLMIIHLCVDMLSRSSFCRTSSSPIHPGTSVLFKKTRRLAPDNLCHPHVSSDLCLDSIHSPLLTAVP